MTPITTSAGYARTAADYYAGFWKASRPRSLDLARYVVMEGRPQSAGLDADVVQHWLGEFAARAAYDAARESSL
jgi:hypothetical protein